MSWASDDSDPAIVIDNGGGVCKAGFAGYDAPRSNFLSVIGRPRNAMQKDLEDFYVGNEAQSRRELLSLQHPIEHGVVTNWDDMERIWQYIYQQGLLVNAQDTPVLLTDPPLNPKINREKTAEIFFETFSCPAFYVAISGMLAIYAPGRVTALMLDIGDTVSHVIPIYEGHCQYQAIRRLDIGGRDITAYLQRLLYTRGYSFTSSSEFDAVRTMKERLGYVALDFEHEIMESATSKKLEKDFELPDGNTITLNSERFRCAEALFQPSLIGLDTPGVHEMYYDALMAVDANIRRDFYCNLVVSGGCTMFPDFADRLRSEIAAKVPPSMRVKVIAPPERKCSVWIGGSILASLSTFQRMWITKKEYEEYGPSLIHRKTL